MPKMLNYRQEKRLTAHINRRVTQSVFRAFDYATAIGTPLNLYAVINLHESVAASAATVFEAIRHKYRDWLNYRSKRHAWGVTPPMYVYAMENPSGSHPHVNWAIHVPEGLQGEFEAKLPRWIERAQGQCGHSDCVIQPIKQTPTKRSPNIL